MMRRQDTFSKSGASPPQVASRQPPAASRKATRLPRVMGSLSRLAMVEAYLVRETMLADLVAHVRKRRWRSSPGEVAGEDPAYFCLGVDGDNLSVPGGYLAWASHGPEADRQLIEALEPFAEA